MKKNVKLIIPITGALFLVFIGIIIYLTLYALPGFEGGQRTICYILIIQTAIWSLAMGAVTIYAAIYLFKLRIALPPDITKAALLSDSNAVLREFNLCDKESALIGKGDSAYIDLKETSDSKSIGYEHAVVNRVENGWFIESVSDEYSVGLKRASDQRVYKLKTGVCYKLCAYDVLYVAKERLLFS